MNLFFDKSYFVKDTALPTQGNETLLQGLMKQAQGEVLYSLLGGVLYNEMDTDSSGEKWQKLLYGHTYTVYYSGIEVPVQWRGLVNKSEKTSLFADFAYCLFLEQTNHIATNTKTVNAENQNSQTISNIYKILPVWNKFIKLYGIPQQSKIVPTAYNFIRYSEYDFSEWIFTELEFKNSFGI